GAQETLGNFAELLSDKLGSEIPYVQISPEQLKVVLEKRGLPDWALQQQSDIMKVVNVGELNMS
ncbi:MAG: hypothetical protein ACE5G1_17565, partial [bacterium]